MNEFFGQVKKIDRKIRRKKLQLEALRASLLPSGIRYDVDRVQTTPQDKVADVMAEIDEITNEIVRLHIKRADAVLRIEKAIDSVEGEAVREAMTAYYLGENVNKEAERMGYSRRQFYRLVNEGLSQVVPKDGTNGTVQSAIVVSEEHGQ